MKKQRVRFELSYASLMHVVVYKIQQIYKTNAISAENMKNKKCT